MAAIAVFHGRDCGLLNSSIETLLAAGIRRADIHPRNARYWVGKEEDFDMALVTSDAPHAAEIMAEYKAVDVIRMSHDDPPSEQTEQTRSAPAKRRGGKRKHG